MEAVPCTCNGVVKFQAQKRIVIAFVLDDSKTYIMLTALAMLLNYAFVAQKISSLPLAAGNKHL